MRVASLFLMVFLSRCATHRPTETRNTPRPEGPRTVSIANTEAYSLMYSIVKTVQDPKWFRDPAINGRCSASLDPTTNLDVPCQNVVIAAIDDKGQEKSRSPVDDGQFRLSVETSKVYYLKVIATLYKVNNDSHIGPLHAGETIDLRLSRK